MYVDWETSVDKSALLERYSDFHPSVLAILKLVNFDKLLDFK